MENKLTCSLLNFRSLFHSLRVIRAIQMEVFHEPRFAGDLNRVVPLLSQLQGMLVEPMRVSVSTHDVIEKVGARRSWRG